MIPHGIPPVYDDRSEILILGSFPSVRSRETGFFYGHPQNRFWRMLAGVYGESVPQTIEEKKDILLHHHLAVWDVISSCEITGSSDASIRDVTPADLSVILASSPVRRVLLNGRTAEKYYRKYQAASVAMPCVCLPSTSAANAGTSLEALIRAWGQALL